MPHYIPNKTSYEAGYLKAVDDAYDFMHTVIDDYALIHRLDEWLVGLLPSRMEELEATILMLENKYK